MCVRPSGRLNCPACRLLKITQSHVRHGTRAEHAKEQRVIGAETARVIGRRDGRPWIARLGVHEREGVMPEREVRTEFDRLLELAYGLVVPPGKPKRPPHGPVSGRIAVV